jgi:hypothetical protein
MGQDILDLDNVFVRRVAAGGALGFDKVTPAICISTTSRARNEDQVVMTLDEAKKVAEAILAHLAEE